MNLLKDYLPLYIGCEVKWCRHIELRAKLTGICAQGHQNAVQLCSQNSVYFERSYDEIKPILRTWSSLSIEEVRDGLGWPVEGCFRLTGRGILKYLGSKPAALQPKEMCYLCSIGIDLFGLIEQKLAIDITRVANAA